MRWILEWSASNIAVVWKHGVTTHWIITLSLVENYAKKFVVV